MIRNIKDMNTIKWIFFDLGGTLIDESKAFSHRFHLQEMTDECKTKNIRYKDLEDAIIVNPFGYRRQYDAVVKKFELKEVIDHDPSYEVLYSNTIDVLEKLSKRYNLGIIANQVKGLKERLNKMNVLAYFKVVVASGDYNVHKPDEKIFRLALNEALAKEDESIMVGDRLDNDIYPSKRIGMKTCWIKQGYGKYQMVISDEYSPDYTINNLDELIKLFL